MKVKNLENMDAIRIKIVDTAQTIMEEEGLEALSMRKIAKRLDYTVGLLYHYFKDKDEILCAITKRGYLGILQVIRESSDPNLECDQRLFNTLKAYIKYMRSMPDLFMILMVQNIEALKDQVNILEMGIRHHRTSINSLCLLIEEGITSGIWECEDVELRSQLIWCGAYGLIQRMIIENVEHDVEEKLIHEYLFMVEKGLRK